MGCVTVTYNDPLKNYLMCVTDGGNTCGRMNTYILESSLLTGLWKRVVYMKNFGEQCYFANFPSKFIGADGGSGHYPNRHSDLDAVYFRFGTLIHAGRVPVEDGRRTWVS